MTTIADQIAKENENKGNEPTQNEGNKPNQNGTKIEAKKPVLMFPKEFPKIVFLRRIPAHSKIPGQNLDEAKVKVGSSFKGNAVLRGLTFAEEIKYLPQIIGVSSDSPNWEARTREYWANISKEVPPGDGVELQVGLQYKSAEDYEADINGERDHNATLINHQGIPINLADYILWRYCLLYSRVANVKEDINKSPKIEMYLFSKDKEISDKKQIQEFKRKANQTLYKRLSERDWVDYILRVLIAQDKRPVKKSIQELSTMIEDEKDILLEEYVETSPALFLALADDKNLELRSFIEIAIAMGKLQRIPNTDTITMDGTTLGNNIGEVISFLNNPKNVSVLQTLKAQVKYTA